MPPRFVGGTKEQVGEQLEQLFSDLALDGLMVQDMIIEHEARLRSYELLAGLI